MKNHHKVSNELIKKLIESNFPFSWNPEDLTIAELLDALPIGFIYHADDTRDWNPKWIYWLQIFPRDFTENWWNWQVEYSYDWSWKYERWTLPNALAEIWLWLKENNYLPNTIWTN